MTCNISVDNIYPRRVRYAGLRCVMFVLLCLCAVRSGWAEERPVVQVYAPAALMETGLMAHILPRFSLKTGLKVETVPAPGTADLSFATEGQVDQVVFRQGTEVWYAVPAASAGAGATRFADWLASDVGLRTITTFAPQGTPLFEPPEATEAAPVQKPITGDATRGLEVSRVACARCHSVDDATRSTALESTPGFGVLRNLSDWRRRFEDFYKLNPHQSFTVIETVTPPFPEDSPSSIEPITLRPADVAAILAYVASLTPADLGAPIVERDTQ